MPKRLYFLSLLLFLTFFQLTAQGHSVQFNKNAFSAKLLFLDYGLMNEEVDAAMISNGLEFAYIRKVQNWLNISTPIKIAISDIPGKINNTTLVGLDAVAQIQYFNGKNKFIPYLMGGLGIVSEDFEHSNWQFPLGLGLNVQLGVNSYLTLQGEVRNSNKQNRDNIHYGIGYLHTIGKKNSNLKPRATSEQVPTKVHTSDEDQDGVPDVKDHCPKTYGKTSLFGCPDYDDDGIADHKDQCPDTKGNINTQGCPDSDEDGVADHLDLCPFEKGKIEYQGCEIGQSTDGTKLYLLAKDSDSDGIADHEDLCPDMPGSKNSNGCPDSDGDGFTNDVDKCPSLAGAFEGCPDTDSDGLVDHNDFCPEEVGSEKNNGCPIRKSIKNEDIEYLLQATKHIEFEVSSNILKTTSHTALDKIADILMHYPDFQLTIQGHTDAQGTISDNQILSENRARACYNYLVESGISSRQLQYIGYGELQPIADNKTKHGRQLNRRVEFILEKF